MIQNLYKSFKFRSEEEEKKLKKSFKEAIAVSGSEQKRLYPVQECLDDGLIKKYRTAISVKLEK